MSSTPQERQQSYPSEGQRAMYLEAWAQADWLSNLVEERVSSFPDDNPEPRLDRKRPRHSNQIPDTPLLQSLRLFETSLVRQSHDDERRNAVEDQLRDECVLKLIQPYGRPEGDDGSIEPIPITFWPGAKFHSHRNAVSNNGIVFIDVRVASRSATRPTPQSEPETKPALAKATAKPGPKSKEAYIRKAIAHCSSTVENWKRLNLSRRVSHYKRYLAAHTDADLNEAGYSPKTFEKFEGKMRYEAKG